MTELDILKNAEPHRITESMRRTGSRFYRGLADALDAADLKNRHLIYTTWTSELLEFLKRADLLGIE